MQGRPVWLASLSRRVPGTDNIRATGRWSKKEIEAGYKRLAYALRGVGDPALERLFRMNVTLCLHRAATVEEVAGLPASWHGDEAGLAGGPIEVLWSKGIEVTDSCLPCKSPKHYVVDRSRPDLWVPIDCRQCGPCRARQACCQSIRSQCAG
jgi:hypothetical protein